MTIDTINFHLQVEEDSQYALEIDSGEELALGLDTAIVVTTLSGDIYEGEYTVTPKPWEEQALATRAKTLADDVTVLAIPYAEVSNLSGGFTVTIGG